MIYAIRNTLLIALFVLSANTFAHKVDDPSKYVTTNVSVTGAVENKLTLSVDDLKKMPQQQLPEVRIVNHEGATTNTLKNLKGVLLRDILDRAKVHAPDHSDVKKIAIIANASDDYKAVYSWNEVFNSSIGDGVIVFFENDGKALGDSDGRIAMMSTKDSKTGMRHVRWLKSLEVRKIVD
jgi:DMSO/TMAO reductase YedYZ molybdopterin-dependent catalytic subunit